ncbi:MAG TPA: ABC transporter substrate-binding protein [Burkholderiales bacterium]|jgi:ABC-type nitrate/sulfonate/bicarbonate transport system substrate-binding protein|nr:ABC transporter substrate-binding protein [Burkholderiales bacterium]
MKRPIAWLLAATLLLAGTAHAQALKKITLFGQPSVNNDAIWMALEHGYFKEQGLEVDYRVFPSGTTALQTFRTGQGDIVMTGDLPSVQYFFNNPGQYQTFAAIERDAKGYVVIARKDIRKPQDLVGKTVATRVGSTGSWFVSEYLAKNGVDPKSVPVKNLDTQLLPAALCKGDISAFFIWQPIGSRTLEICANDAHQLSDATGYIQGYLVAGARAEFLSSADGADKVVRFLRAIIKGRARAESDFRAVAAFAAKTYSLSEKATRDQWETNIRPIALDRVYYQDFCSLSKWAQGAGLQSQPLDFAKLTWPNGLRAIDPKLAEAPPPPC